jgi:transglutaminase-like putative cysteine protease
MRIGIHHRTVYTYGAPALSVIQILRLTPRNHEGQFVRRWQIDVDHDASFKAREDAFGNLTHTLSLSGPLDRLVLTIEGEVDTLDFGGVVRGSRERLPVGVFLRETPLTKPSPAIAEFAGDVAADAGAPLDILHDLMVAVHREIVFDTVPTDPATSAATAFTLKCGVCQDLAHVFIASARCLGIPARYVSGYLMRSDGLVEQEASHAWAEAYVDGLGWVGFDPANGICPTDAHVRVAVGLDYLGAAPVRGSRYGGNSETMDVAVIVDQAGSQRQT